MNAVATEKLTVCPVTRDEAQAFVARNHRHTKRFLSWRFGCGLRNRAGELRGVAAASRPSARELDDGYTIELIRVCSLGDRNACSQLYGALCRAAKALGFRRAVTYTLATEPGVSLRAAGFERVAEVRAREFHGGRARYVTNLFGEEERPVEGKVRWERALTS